jgi:hypothetical protein
MLSGGEADAPIIGDPEPSTPADPEPSTPADPEPLPPADPVGSIVARRARENPAPVVALLFGFLIALRVLRRRP